MQILKDTNWKYVKILKDENAVDHFLSENKVTLPQEILTVIKRYNGGRPAESLFRTDSFKDKVFKNLFSYNENDLETIYAIYNQSFQDKGLYPIGSDSSGDLVCVDLKNQYQLVLLHGESQKIEVIY